MSQLWEKVLYPSFLDTINGEYYRVISDAELRCELYNLAQRAIAAFKFPKVSLEYDAKYYIYEKKPDGGFEKIEVSSDEDWMDVSPYFINDVTYKEIEIVIAWMKVYWAESQASNADNFLDLYTDANIKTFSRANALDKYLKFITTFKHEARELENRYSRVTKAGASALGEVNSDEL